MIESVNLGFIITGSLCEIIGFIMMLKYVQTPRLADLKSWEHRNENFKTKETVTMILRKNPKVDKYETESVFDVPIEFLDFWDRHRNIGIISVICGLFLQLIQLGI